MLNLFVDTAFAQGTPAAQPAMWEMLVMPAGFLLIMYFFMIRPQQKRAKDHQSFLTALKAGDEVVTTGGIIGRVKTVQDTFVSIEVAANTVIKVVKSEVSGLTQKSTVPAKA
jgi:preprotein translocase subunit YajC